MPFKADLHNHLRTSVLIREGDFDSVCDIVMKRLGPSGVMGLCNFGDDRYERFISLKGYEREYLDKEKRGIKIVVPGSTGVEYPIFIVKGQEIPAKQGHLLVLGLPTDVHLKHGQTLEDTIKQVKDYNGIVIADHPFHIEGCGPYLKKNPEVLEQLDAIEIFNGEASLPFLFKWFANHNAQRFYESVRLDFPNLGGLSSSDGHSFSEIGQSYNILRDNGGMLSKRIPKSDFFGRLKYLINDHRSFDGDKRSGIFGVKGAVKHCFSLAYYVGEIYVLGEKYRQIETLQHLR